MSISSLAFSAKSGQSLARVDHDGFDLLAEHAALGVDLFGGHQHDVAQRRFRNGHGARQRVQDPDLDRILASTAETGSTAAASIHAARRFNILRITLSFLP